VCSKGNRKVTNKLFCCQPDVLAGDLIYVIQQEPHSTFERSGDHLVMNHTLSLVESLCGFQMVVKQLDGRNLVVTRPPGEVVPSGKMSEIMIIINMHHHNNI